MDVGSQWAKTHKNFPSRMREVAKRTVSSTTVVALILAFEINLVIG